MKRWLGVGVALLVSGCAVGQGAKVMILRDERIGSNRAAVLLADLLYCYPPTGEVIIVPRGYVTDFASVPDGAHRVVERYGNNIEAAIVHDWLYAVGEPGRRRFADDVFRYAMAEQGTGPIQRRIAWAAVRIGGNRAYGSDAEWAARFYDGERDEAMPPPFERPATAITTRVADCKSAESRRGSAALIEEFGSHTWKLREALDARTD